MVEGKYKPVKVTASASTGIATSEPYNCAPQTEDTITLLTEWESLSQPGRKGTASKFQSCCRVWSGVERLDSQ